MHLRTKFLFYDSPLDIFLYRNILLASAVSMGNDGHQRLERVNGERLKTVPDSARTFDKLWKHQLERVKERAERKARERNSSEEQ